MERENWYKFPLNEALLICIFLLASQGPGLTKTATVMIVPLAAVLKKWVVALVLDWFCMVRPLWPSSSVIESWGDMSVLAIYLIVFKSRSGLTRSFHNVFVYVLHMSGKPEKKNVGGIFLVQSMRLWIIYSFWNEVLLEKRFQIQTYIFLKNMFVSGASKPSLQCWGVKFLFSSLCCLQRWSLLHTSCTHILVDICVHTPLSTQLVYVTRGFANSHVVWSFATKPWWTVLLQVSKHWRFI